jgi:hypothetical protein
MSYQQVSYLIQVGVFLSYLLYIVWIYGVLSSISESFYELEKEKKRFLFWDRSMMFTVWASCQGICVMLSGSNSIFTNIAGFGMLLVGIAPYFKDKVAKYVHYAGAVIAILAIQGYIFEIKQYEFNCFGAASLLLSFLLKDITDNWLWWLEILMFACYFMAQLIHLF